MPIYHDNSGNHPDQGMTIADMNAVQRVAAQRDEIIMFRDTGCWSRPYIGLGHPTKPFHIKGKSSDWGPHAGLVPYNSEFSKAFSAAAIKKGFDLNKQAIAHNYARPIPLFVSESFIRNELLVNKSSANRPPIDRMTTPREGVAYFFCTKPNDDPALPGRTYVLMGKKAADGRYQILTLPPDATNERTLFLKESAAEPMLVLTVPGAELPITGDYDLFAVCPSWAGYGGDDRKMDPTLDDPVQNRSVQRTHLTASMVPTLNQLPSVNRAQQSLAAIHAAFTPEDPHRGNGTPRIFAVIEALTAAMGGRFPRVHHNAESGRPFAPGAEDGFPLTIFHPRRGIAGFGFLNATINSTGDLLSYFRLLYTHGYYPPRNRAWQMNAFLRDDAAIKQQLTQIYANRRARDIPNH